MKPIIYKVIILIMLYIISISYITFRRNKEIRDYINIRNLNIREELEIIRDHYEATTKFIYEESLNKENIKRIIFKAIKSDSSKKGEYRKQLKGEVESLYYKLKELDIQQLHFHLNDNTSFLRMNAPEKYGDDLTDLRETVEIVNRTSSFYKGFEEGRTFDGYRYVFPLRYNHKHIGSLELSLSMEVFLKTLSKTIQGHNEFILKSSLIERKDYKEKRKYEEIDFSNNFYIADNLCEDECIPKDVMKKINIKIKDKIRQKLEYGESFGVTERIDLNSYLINFISIEDIYENTVAYIISYEESYEIQLIEKRNLYSYFFVTSFLILILAFLIYRKKVNDKLKIKRENLRILNDSKDKLFSIISHDLRSPFNGILAISSFLEDEIETLSQKEIKEYINDINTEANNFYKLLENLLQWSTNQRKGIKYNPEKVNVSEIIQKVKYYVKGKAKKKRIEIDITNNLDKKIYTDPQLLIIILRNIINNSIKFTPKGGTIKINIKEKDRNIILIIEDTGVGISKKKIEKLFNINGELSTNGTEGERGTGLGLIIVKDSIDKINGTIKVESAMDKGTKVTIKIPIEN